MMRKLLVVGVTGIIAGIWIWQYTVAREETDILEARLEQNQMVLKKVLQVNHNIVRKRKELERTNNRLEELVAKLPEDHLYTDEFIASVQTACTQHDARCKLLGMTSRRKQIYSEADIQMELAGTEDAIRTTLGEVAKSKRLMNRVEACYWSRSQNGDDATLLLQIQIYSTSSGKDNLTPPSSPANRESKTWFPPWPTMVNEARQEAFDLKQKINAMPEAMELAKELDRKKMKLEKMLQILRVLQRNAQPLEKLTGNMGNCSPK